jgi:uncharacterized membrane-anchored protein YitT (DUF2179 family)
VGLATQLKAKWRVAIILVLVDVVVVGVGFLVFVFVVHVVAVFFFLVIVVTSLTNSFPRVQRMTKCCSHCITCQIAAFMV